MQEEQRWGRFRCTGSLVRPARQCTTLGSHLRMTRVNTAGGISVGLGSLSSFDKPPTNVSAFPFALSPVRLFQSAAREVIDQRRGLDVSGLFNGQPVRYCYKTQYVLPLVDVSLRVKRSVALLLFSSSLLLSGTCRTCTCRTFLQSPDPTSCFTCASFPLRC